MTLKTEIGFVVSFIAISLIIIAGGLTETIGKRKQEIEEIVRKHDNIFGTIPEKSDRTCLRATLYSAYWDLEQCRDLQKTCDKKVYNLNDKLRVTMEKLLDVQGTLLAARQQISEKDSALLAAQKQISDLTFNLNTTCRTLERRTVSVKAMIIRTCEEFVEQRIFPNWLLALPITRKEKWILAIASLESPFAESMRKMVNNTYDKFENGVITVASGMDSIYNDISQRFTHPTTPEDILIPTDESQIEETCKAVVLNDVTEIQLVCKLIFQLRNMVAAMKSSLDGQIHTKSNETTNAIFYGIIRRNDGKSFPLVKETLDEVSKNFDGCQIVSNRFWNKIDEHAYEPETEAFITFKAVCPENTVFKDFCDHTREQLEGFLNEATAETDLQIVEDPVNPGKQTVPST